MPPWIFKLILCWIIVGTNYIETRKHTGKLYNKQRNEEHAEEIDKLLSIALEDKTREIDVGLAADVDGDLEILKSVLKDKAAKKLRLRHIRWTCWTCDYARVRPHKKAQNQLGD